MRLPVAVGTTVACVELSPEMLRDIRFTERFRGYDAAEVDAFLIEAAGALEELITERSEPMAALAAERARLAIEQVRQETLGEVAELQSRRDELAQAVADLQLMLADRRRGILEALALIDATSEPAPDPGADAAPSGDAEAEPADEVTAETADEAEIATGADEAPETDSFLARLERAAAESGESGPG